LTGAKQQDDRQDHDDKEVGTEDISQRHDPRLVLPLVVGAAVL
jgi:hypothetical protein